MRRRAAAVAAFAAVAFITLAACGPRRQVTRFESLGESGANIRRTGETSGWTPTPTFPPVAPEQAAGAFAELLGVTLSPAPLSPTETKTGTPSSTPRERPGKKTRSRVAIASPTPSATRTPTPVRTPTSPFVAFESRTNAAFGVGERLVFEVRYMGVTGGTATMEIPEIMELGSDRVFHIHTTAESSPFFSRFFRVHDQVDSYMDTKYLFSRRLEKRIEEGKFLPKPQRWDFDQLAETATDHDGKVSKIARGSQDILSSFFYFRTMPLSNESYVTIPVYADGKSYELLVRIERRETVSLPIGTFKTLVIEPQMKFEGIFQQKGKVTVWVTDDDRRVPVMVQSKVVIGSIDIVLVDAKVLAPLSSP